MKVRSAKTAGFCMGVRRAMEIVLTEANRRKEPLYTYGPLIHNRQVLALLETKGVKAVEGLEGLKRGTIIIRAHGIPPQERQEIRQTGLTLIDATCPKVARVQAIIRYHTKKDATAVIVGNKEHAEVKGLMGYSQTPAHVIQSVEEVFQLPHLENGFVVAQTTQNQKNFQAIVAAIQKRFPGIQIFNTICEATSNRQEEVRSLAGHVAAMVVVGGYHSGNTQRLVQVAQEVGLPAFHVETEKDLDTKRLSGMKVIGVTAGASTPNWMIKNVVRKIEGIRGKREAALAPWFKNAFKFLLANNIAVSLGAFCLAYAEAILSQRPPEPLFPLLAFLYVYAMHVFNRFLDKGASAYNDPERAASLRKHKTFLILTGLAAIATGQVIALFISIKTFFVLCGLSLLGIMYSVPLLPEKTQARFPYYKIKDIPGSRSLSESLAWVAIISILPLLEMAQIQWPAAVIGIFFVFALSYVRSTLIDIFEVQGDLIVGTETLPIILGEKKTLLILKLILLVTGIVLVGCPLFGLVGFFSYFMLIPVGALFFCLATYERGYFQPGIILETMVEGNFFLAGLLALLWQAG